jgi:hypothetical protein
VNRLVIVLALAAAAMAIAGCGGGGGDNAGSSSTEAKGPPPPPLKHPAKAKESIDQAGQRIAGALGSGDCKTVNSVNPLSRPTVSTDARCKYLQRFKDMTVQGAEAFDGGGVIAYTLGQRTLNAVVVVDDDGLFHLVYIDPFIDENSVGTKLAPQFKKAAKKAVTALKDKDCATFLTVAYRRVGAAARSDEDVCGRIDNNQIAHIYDAYPDAKLKPLGGNADYAFFGIETPVFYTVVLARQPKKISLPQPHPLPAGAGEYAYFDTFRTNRRGPPQ